MRNKYFTKNHGYVFLALAVLLLVLAGCKSSSTTASVSTSLPHTATATANATTSGTTATATLSHQPTGTASFSWDHTTHLLTVQLSLTGLAPNSTHPVRIHQGNCSNITSTTASNMMHPLYTLTNITANAHGVASATSKLTVRTGIPAGNWYMTIHNGPSLANASQAMTIACANITNTNTSQASTQTAQTTFQATGAANQKASGTTHMSLSGHTLTVQVTVTGLVPGSQHAVHIHAGSCTNQGAVIYNLTTLKADASGKATSTTTIQNISSIPASGWYVNVHDSSNISTQTGFDPIACGNVMRS